MSSGLDLILTRQLTEKSLTHLACTHIKFYLISRLSYTRKAIYPVVQWSELTIKNNNTETTIQT